MPFPTALVQEEENMCVCLSVCVCARACAGVSNDRSKDDSNKIFFCFFLRFHLFFSLGIRSLHSFYVWFHIIKLFILFLILSSGFRLREKK